MNFNGLVNNPLLAMGAGLLDQRNTYGSFGSALNKGLLAGAQAQQGAQTAAFMKMQMDAYQKERDRDEKRQERIEKARADFPGMLGTKAAGPTPFEQDLFPGEQQIPGLLNAGAPATGMWAQSPEMAGMLSSMGQYDPIGTQSMLVKSQLDAMQPQDPTSNMQNYQYLVGMGVPHAEAMKKAFSGGVTVNTGDQPVAPAVPWTPEQKKAWGFNPDDVVMTDAKTGGPKVVQKEKDITAEQAGKTQMILGAQSRLPNIENLLFDEGGTINRKNITNSRLAFGKPVPGTVGHELGTYYEEGIQAITRSETGAAMPESEVDNARTRFQPKMMDSDPVVKIKWQMYQDFLNGYLKLVDPKGKFMNEAFDAELQSRLKLNQVDPAGSSGWSIEEVK